MHGPNVVVVVGVVVIFLSLSIEFFFLLFLHSIGLPHGRGSKGQDIAGGIISIDSGLRNDYGTNDPTRTAIPTHGMTTRLFGQGPRFFGTHAQAKFGIQQSRNKDGTTAAGGKGELQTSSTQGNGIDTSTLNGIPSGHNDSGLETILVLINQTSHQMRSRLDSGLTSRRQTNNKTEKRGKK